MLHQNPSSYTYESTCHREDYSLPKYDTTYEYIVSRNHVETIVREGKYQDTSHYWNPKILKIKTGYEFHLFFSVYRKQRKAYEKKYKTNQISRFSCKRRKCISRHGSSCFFYNSKRLYPCKKQRYKICYNSEKYDFPTVAEMYTLFSDEMFPFVYVPFEGVFPFCF